jgi:hypothetical protein
MGRGFLLVAPVLALEVDVVAGDHAVFGPTN